MTETGTRTGTGIETEPGSEPGIEPGTEPGTGAGPGSEPGCRSVSGGAEAGNLGSESAGRTTEVSEADFLTGIFPFL